MDTWYQSPRRLTHTNNEVVGRKEPNLNINEWIAGGDGLLAVLLTLVQIAPVKFNPIVKAVGRVVNADVLRELDSLKTGLDDHIRVDDKRLQKHDFFEEDDERLRSMARPVSSLKPLKSGRPRRARTLSTTSVCST